MKKAARYGMTKEIAVAKDLRKRGAVVERSPGSRGPWDMRAKFPSGRQWNVQVKSTSQERPSQIDPAEIRRLKISVSRSKATAVVAQVVKNRILYRSARTGRKLSN